MKDFRDRVAVVTGAASGIGRGMAERFAAEGMRVVLADVEGSALDAAALEMGAAGALVLAVRTDVSDAAQVEALAGAAYDAFGAVHVLCNNAGVATGGLCWEQTLDDWRWVVGVNLWGVIYGIHSFVPRMIAGGEEGHVVNTASVAGLISGPGSAPYAVTKHGVVALSETLHHQLAMVGSRLRVSVLCPGWVNTRILESGRNRPPELAETHAYGTTPEMQTAFAKLVTDGMAPSEVARQVFEAVRDERFYVITHPEMKALVERRLRDIVDGRNPQAPAMPGLPARSR